MQPEMTPPQEQQGEAKQVVTKAPSCHKTTLYDVMAALQSVVEPDEDDLVVEIVVRWLRTWRMTRVGNTTVAA